MIEAQPRLYPPRSEQGQKWTKNIVEFMKGISIYVDPEAEIERLCLNMESLQEEQLMFMITRAAFRDAPSSEIYQALQGLTLSDLTVLNLNSENLHYFITAIGGFFYAKSIKKLVLKQQILQTKEILTQKVYHKVLEFAQNHNKYNYTLKDPIAEYLHAAGHRVFGMYFDELPAIIQEIARLRTGYELPQIDMSYLKISKEYALEMVHEVQKIIFHESNPV